MSDFCTRLRRWREREELSQEEAKTRLNIRSRSYFSQLENGLRTPSRKIVNALRDEEAKSEQTEEALRKVGISTATVQDRPGQYQFQGRLHGADGDMIELVRILTAPLSVSEMGGLIPKIQAAQIDFSIRDSVIGALGLEIEERAKEKK